MTLVTVFDPPMCCPSGACGPAVDPTLPRFAADLQWLKSQGVRVERYSLTQQPDKFVESDVVRSALSSEGNECLPLVLVNGEIGSRGAYPSREELARLANLNVEEGGECAPTVSELPLAQECDPAVGGCCSPKDLITTISPTPSKTKCS